MVTPLHVPLIAAAALLVAAGVAKARDPDPLHGALRASGIPIAVLATRAIGAVEIATGVAVLIGSSRAALGAMTLLYAAFAAFILNAIARSLPIDSCGCFGADSAPPTSLHVAVNAALAATSGAAAFAPPESLRQLLADDLGSGGAIAASGFALAVVLWVVVSELGSR